MTSAKSTGTNANAPSGPLTFWGIHPCLITGVSHLATPLLSATLCTAIMAQQLRFCQPRTDGTRKMVTPPISTAVQGAKE
ncbi:hypothetical protein ACFX13_044879 [Malus domestica]